MNVDDCLFCKIVAGEIPVTKIYEDDIILSFLDIGPISEGHTLVIPKQHYEKIHLCPPELMAQVAMRIGKIAQAVMTAMKAEGYNLLCNNGKAAGQVIDHLHFHIIPRNSGDGVFNRWLSFKYQEGKIEDIAKRICENL